MDRLTDCEAYAGGVHSLYHHILGVVLDVKAIVLTKQTRRIDITFTTVYSTY